MITINGLEFQDKRFPDNTFNMTANAVTFLNNQVANIEAAPDMAYNRQRAQFERSFEEPFCIEWYYERPEELLMLQFIVRHLRDKLGAQHINLFMPYVPNARMDRTKEPMAEVNVLKYFCQIINELNFNCVQVFDVHSDATLNQLDRCIQVPTKDFVLDVVDGHHDDGLGYDFLFFPDAGAQKRYGSTYNFRPFLVGEKTRDWSTGRLQNLIAHNPMNLDLSSTNIAGKRILIVDDICSYGGTFLMAAQALKNIGFEHIGLYVTHCEDSIYEGHIFDEGSPIEKVYTTKSLHRREPTYTKPLVTMEID
jgi:ribose-phosphate pyrophosphokinase